MRRMIINYMVNLWPKVVRQIAKDIHEETDLKLPYQTMVAGDDIYNKIEGMSRLTMIDLRNRV